MMLESCMGTKHEHRLKWFLGKSMLRKIVYEIYHVVRLCCLSYRTGSGVPASCNNYDLSLINKLELYFTLRNFALAQLF